MDLQKVSEEFETINVNTIDYERLIKNIKIKSSKDNDLTLKWVSGLPDSHVIDIPLFFLILDWA